MVHESAGYSGSAALSVDQAPPILVPFRFFLTAPLFGTFAALLLLFLGPAAWASRWSAGILAATHLMALGFLTMVMMGALLQMLPVVAGAPVARAHQVSALVHPMLVMGTLALAWDFLSGGTRVMAAALALLGSAFIVFIAAITASLLRARAAAATVRGMRLSVAALPLTVVLGMSLAVIRTWHVALPFATLVTLHLAWGLGGWVGLLVIGVGIQVVPMFQTTPPYPRIVAENLTPMIFSALLGWSLLRVLAGHAAPDSAGAFIFLAALGYALYAVITLALQRRKRRRIPDITVRFWRTGMVSLLACALCGLSVLWPGGRSPMPIQLTWGILAIVGFGVSVVSGMLYKIVPFLVWLHLSARPDGRGRLSNMKQIISVRHANIQFWLHLASILLLCGAALAPGWLARPAAAVFACSNLLLGLNLAGAWRLYRGLVSGSARS